MELIVRKWGNSAVVRIPAVMRAAHLSVDQAVDMRAEDGRIIVEPLREDVYDLADLVAGITEENKHAEVDFGAPVGAEVW
jgi:antitoxin MazE